MKGEIITTRVRDVIRHNREHTTLVFDPVLPPAKPGQFALAWLPGVDEKPFSFSASEEDRIEITVKAVGPFTRRLCDACPGDPIGLRGPLGRPFTLRTPALLLGGGCGAAPIRALARAFAAAGQDTTILLGARTEDDLLHVDEFEDWNTRFYTEDGSFGAEGLLTLGLPPTPDPETLVYAAGPEPMLLAVKAWCEDHDLDYQLSFERYMKCGIGVCGHCALDGAGLRMCIEGPVLGPADLTQVTDLGRPHRGPTGARDTNLRRSGSKDHAGSVS